jgi:hypothetical protein
LGSLSFAEECGDDGEEESDEDPTPDLDLISRMARNSARQRSTAASSGRMIVHMVALAAARLPTAVRLKESQTLPEIANVPIRISTPPTPSDPKQKGTATTATDGKNSLSDTEKNGDHT